MGTDESESWSEFADDAAPGKKKYFSGTMLINLQISNLSMS